jgi:hypothetical protein
MAEAKILKLTPGAALVAIKPFGRQFGSKLAYIKKEESDAVGDIIEIPEGFTFKDYRVWNKDTETMELVMSGDVVCQTLEWA